MIHILSVPLDNSVNRTFTLFDDEREVQYTKITNGATLVSFLERYFKDYTMTNEFEATQFKNFKEVDGNEFVPILQEFESPINDPVSLEEWILDWGQTHVEICGNLGYEMEDSDELLMDDYFWVDMFQMWFPKNSSIYSEEDEKIANILRNKIQ